MRHFYKWSWTPFWNKYIYFYYYAENIFIYYWVTHGDSCHNTGLLHDFANNKEKEMRHSLVWYRIRDRIRCTKEGGGLPGVIHGVATSPLNIIKNNLQKHVMAYSPVLNISVHVKTDFTVY